MYKWQMVPLGVSLGPWSQRWGHHSNSCICTWLQCNRWWRLLDWMRFGSREGCWLLLLWARIVGEIAVLSAILFVVVMDIMAVIVVRVLLATRAGPWLVSRLGMIVFVSAITSSWPVVTFPAIMTITREASWAGAMTIAPSQATCSLERLCFEGSK